MEYKRCCSCMTELEREDAVCPNCGYDNAEGPKAQPDYALPCNRILNGRYVTGRMLGRSGTGITYIAYDLVSETPVCVREYFPEGAAVRSRERGCAVRWGRSQQALERMQLLESFVEDAHRALELTMLRQTAMVRSAFYENDTAYIVTDYIEGVTLEQSMQRSGQVYTERQCIAVLGPIMRDLGQMHAHGLVHRNVNPDNIMLRPDGSAVLLGFGDVNLPEPELTAVSAVRQGCRAPEQRSGGEVGPWTDIYAMCAVICYCKTGYMPPSMSERAGGKKAGLRMFTPDFARVLAKGLAVSPSERIQSMDELLERLREVILSEPEEGGHRGILLGGAAVIVLLAAAAIFLLPRLAASSTKPIVFPTAAATASEKPVPASSESLPASESTDTEESQTPTASEQPDEALEPAETAEPDSGEAAEGTEPQDQEGLLTGRYGTEEWTRKGWVIPLYLDRPVVDCTQIRLDLRVTEHGGYPYGWFYIYAKDLDGGWDHIAKFRIQKEQGDGQPTVYELTTDSPQSFVALSILPAELGMDYTAEFDSQYHVPSACISAYSETIPAPDFTPLEIEDPFNSTHSISEWIKLYEKAHAEAAEAEIGEAESGEAELPQDQLQ